MKLWTQATTNDKITAFTVGNDRHFDLQLARFDVLGSIAHAKMLSAVSLISEKEEQDLNIVLKDLLQNIDSGQFSIDDTCEDVHSQIEFILTTLLGETGKKIHTARSRNDQSLLDIKLFCREEIRKTVEVTEHLFNTLMEASEKHRSDLLPGFTHLQLAMPSSFGLWFAAYGESLADDLEMMLSAYRITNKNPLGSAAGYGSSFPIDRELTTKLLGFESMNVNSIYAQMTRGKTEKVIASSLAALASTLSKFAMDCTLFMNQEFGYISFPDELTTGSSIMPHKKNPDVFEMIRGKCNRLQSLPNEFALLLTNLSSGYHRELQLTKEILFPAFNTLRECMDLCILMIENIRVKKDILEDSKYDLLFTVEKLNSLVMEGMSFRDAYHRVASEVGAGKFERGSAVKTVHTGSIHQPGNVQILTHFKAILSRFPFAEAEEALRQLSQ